MKGSSYSKKTDFKLRLVAIAGLVILILRIVTDFIFWGDDTQFADGYFPIYVYYIMNGLLVLMFAYLIWKPFRLEFVAYAAFPYALIVLLDRRSTPLGVNLFAVGMIALYCRGLLRTHPVRKAVVAVVSFIVPALLRLRFGLGEFIEWLPDTVVQIFTLGIIFTLQQSAHQLRKKANPDHEVLRLGDYPDFNDRDKEWIRLALANTKFDTIASQYGVTSGTVKNRMRQIYKILGVSDRLSMIVAYGKCEVVF